MSVSLKPLDGFKGLARRHKLSRIVNANRVTLFNHVKNGVWIKLPFFFIGKVILLCRR